MVVVVSAVSLMSVVLVVLVVLVVSVDTTSAPHPPSRAVVARVDSIGAGGGARVFPRRGRRPALDEARGQEVAVRGRRIDDLI